MLMGVASYKYYIEIPGLIRNLKHVAFFSMLNSQIRNACLPQDTFESEVNFTEGTIKVERGPESISSSVMSH